MFRREVIDQPPVSATKTKSTMAEETATEETSKTPNVYKAKANCSCGKVQTMIQTLPNDQAPTPIRLVCYCRDCRGYFETLSNRQCQKNIQYPDNEEEIEEMEPTTNGNENLVNPSATNEWGGVDWTCLYPRDVQIIQGKELLKVVKIRSGSNIRQVYSTCCHSPMFRIGGVSMLVNSSIISTQESALPPIQYHIIGRQAWKNCKNIVYKESPMEKKPKMSWSVPWKWYFAMPQRIRSDLMEPMPLEFEESQVQVLEGFQEGSKWR